jgi:hypothetical protein
MFPGETVEVLRESAAGFPDETAAEFLVASSATFPGKSLAARLPQKPALILLD